LEVDVFLENGDKVMIVEIKATPTMKDVNEHIARMEKLRKGFFVIVPSGDTFDIIKPEGKNRIKEW
jgi:hypothetical protein